MTYTYALSSADVSQIKAFCRKGISLSWAILLLNQLPRSATEVTLHGNLFNDACTVTYQLPDFNFSA